MATLTKAHEQWLSLCERSLRIEQKKQYCNVKGKEKFFADFMLQQAEAPWVNDLNAPISNRLKNIFTLYPLASVIERKSYIQESWQHLEQLRQSLRPRKQYAGDQAIKKAVIAQQHVMDKSGISDWRDVPVQFVKSVGPKLGENFAKVGVNTVGDLITYYPRKHLDYSTCTRIAELRVDDMATVWGTIYRVSSYSPPGKPQLSILKLIIRDGSGRLTLSFFQRGNAFMRRQMASRFPQGASILMSGKVKWDKFSKGLTLDNPEYEVIDNIEDSENGHEEHQKNSLHMGRIVPIYPLTEGLNVKWVRRAIYNALLAFQNKIRDPFPASWQQRLQLMPWGQALQQFHYPTDEKNLAHARKRLVFQELFFTQLGLQYRRKQREIHMPGKTLRSQGKLAAAFLESLPFTLTGAQQRVHQEVMNDLSRPEAMNRLVQGDVGSGKTVVAVLALLEAIESGYQGALMAPTEILAEQHFQKIFAWMLPLNIQVELLKGAQGAKVRRETLARIASGEARLVIGTHALIQDKVDFANLGLAVIDEQHRFGVKQRATLRDKGLNNGQHPEILSMTATPIPRTLALTQHGDLEVSSIDELPPGRKPVETKLMRSSQREQLWNFMRQELEAGRQCYVVFPLVEASEKMDLKAATVEFEHYRDTVFPQYGVGLLHGKMKAAEKEQVMADFVAHKLHILVATTVIEVGVDVPNASVMVIEHANRFGLAQLHQLRGRVGRGADKAYCYLVADKSSEIAKERLKIFTTTHDGFVIAEQDLKLRGPGEFMGTRQSGLPDMLLANLVEDTLILEAARDEAKALIEKDPELHQKEHLLLKSELFRFFRNHLQLLNA